MKQGPLAYAGLAFALPLLLYLKVIDSGFLSDDYGFVPIYNITWPDLVRCLGLIHGGDLAIHPFRPVAFASLWLDYHIYGWNPVGFHLTNILLHSLNALLLFFLARSLRMPDRAAFVAALFYGLYPGHPEAVTWISGRFDILSHTFFLGSLLSWIYGRSRGRGWWMAASSVLYLLSLYSKETTAAGIVLFPLIDWLFASRPVSLKGYYKSGFLIGWLLVQAGVLLSFLLVRIGLFGSIAGDAGWTRLDPFPNLTIPLVMSRLMVDIRMLMAPVNGQIFDIRVAQVYGALNVALIAGGLGFSIVALIKKEVLPFKSVIFGIVWTLIFLIPTLPIGLVKDNLDCSRFLYIPAAGIALIAGAGIYHLSQASKFARSASVVLFAAWILASSAVLWQHNGVWIETGGLGRQIDRCMCENTCDIVDGTTIVVVNLPWLWKGVHLAPNGYSSYLEVVHGKRKLDLEYVEKGPEAIGPWLENLKQARNPYICFLWDSSEEILVPLE